MSINNNNNNQVNFFQPLPTATNTNAQKQQIHVSRELDGVNDTGIIGELLTIGTNNLSEANKYFAMSKFGVSGLLAEDNQAVSNQASISNAEANHNVICADDMYVAGDPGVGGKGNNYQYNHIDVAPGYFTMFEDGQEGGPKITINSHVEEINPEGNKAFTEYGFVVQNADGQKTKATLSGGQLTIIDANGQQQKLLPGQTYFVGSPTDPTAKFYYADVPGAGENGASEMRLMVDYFEKPSQEGINKLMAQGVPKLEAEKLRTKTTASFGFRVPDGNGTYRLSEGVGSGTALKATAAGVKTYYDTHFSEGNCSVLEIYNSPPPPPPSYPPTPPTEPPAPPPPPSYPPVPPTEPPAPPPPPTYPPVPPTEPPAPPPPPSYPPTPPAPPPPPTYPPVPPTEPPAPPPPPSYPPTPPPPPPPPNYPPVAPDEHARIWGDPHVVEADAGKYDFNQKGFYSILKDKDIELNTKMVAGPGKTTVNGEAGLTIGSRTVHVKADGSVSIGFSDPTIKAANISLQNGQTVMLGANASITRNGNIIKVDSPEYKVQFETNKTYKGSVYIDIDVWSKSGGVMSDGTAPTGLLGETFDTDSLKQTQPKLSNDAYKVGSLFTTSTVSTPPVPPPATTTPPVNNTPPANTPPAQTPPGNSGTSNGFPKMFQQFMAMLMQFFKQFFNR